MDDRDREVLAFAAAHRLIIASQVGVLLEANPDPGLVRERLEALELAGLLRRVRLARGDAGCFAITGAGLRAIGSDLPVPGLGLGRYRHDVGVAWLWLAARDGRFGTVHRLFSNRELPAFDGFASAAGRFGGGPDLLLVVRGGWVAVYLQLSFLGGRRLEKLLIAYGADARFGVVLFMVDDARIGRIVESAAAAVGLSDVTHVQWAILD